MAFISFNAQLAIAAKEMQFPPKELAADECTYQFNPEINNSTVPANSSEEFHSVFKISYMW